jgi:hypothetical protein
MRLVSTLIAMLVAMAPTMARAIEPAPKRRATVEVDTSDVGDAGPIIQRRVEERADVVLRDAEVLPGVGSDDPIIRIDIHEIDGDDPGFSFDLHIEQGGRAVGQRRHIECNLCTETEIVAKAELEIDAIIEDLPTEREAAPVTTGPGLVEHPTAEPTDTGPSTDSKRAALGPKGKAGVGLLVLGGASAIVGIGLSIPKWTPVADDPTRERSPRPVGWALVGVGGAALVTGAVLLALDRRAAAGRRTRAWVAPGRQMATFGLSRRF